MTFAEKLDNETEDEFFVRVYTHLESIRLESLVGSSFLHDKEGIIRPCLLIYSNSKSLDQDLAFIKRIAPGVVCELYSGLFLH